MSSSASFLPQSQSTTISGGDFNNSAGGQNRVVVNIHVDQGTQINPGNESILTGSQNPSGDSGQSPSAFPLNSGSVIRNSQKNHSVNFFFFSLFQLLLHFFGIIIPRWLNLQNAPAEERERPNARYERHLLVEKHGFPLWAPQPHSRLPLSYRRRGISVGDVGIITRDGYFDFLFNICLPPGDPSNPEILPNNFSPVDLSPPDISEWREHDSGSCISSSTTEKLKGLSFKCNRPEGSILVMPNGAYHQDLLNLDKFKTMSKNAEDWYRFAMGSRGREVRNGELCLVTGCDKTNSWGIATYSDGRPGTLTLVANGVQPPVEYTWEYEGRVEAKAGPKLDESLDDAGNREYPWNIRNQCTFLRSYTFTLPDKVWKTLASTLIHDSSTVSGSFFGFVKLFFSIGASHSEDWNNLSVGNRGRSVNVRGHGLRGGRFTSHPARIINQMLLSQYPNAKVAVSHDNDWCAVIREDEIAMPDTTELLARIRQTFTFHLDEDGTVYLSQKHAPEEISQRQSPSHVAIPKYSEPDQEALPNATGDLHDEDVKLTAEDRGEQFEGPPNTVLGKGIVLDGAQRTLSNETTMTGSQNPSAPLGDSGQGPSAPPPDPRTQLHSSVTSEAHAPTEMMEPPNTQYERHLSSAGHGFPLWAPQPHSRLPLSYRRKGVSIGDVGIINKDGYFDFLFNICLPRGHSSNPEFLPINFSPVELLPTDISEYRAHDSGSCLLTSSMEKLSGLTFKCNGTEGSILVMPNGAYHEDLLNLDKFKRIALQNAENWYRFAIGTCGRDIGNGELRLVTGCDKTNSWGIATYSNGRPGSLISLVADADAVESLVPYCWLYEGRVEAKAGPRLDESLDAAGNQEYPRDIRNQCTFLRSFTVTLPDKIWMTMVSTLIQDSPDTHILNSREPRSYFRSIVPGSFFGLGGGGGTVNARNRSLRSKNSTIHPATIINQMLLSQYPNAKVAISHDSDWCAVMREDEIAMPDASELLARIRESFVSHSTEDGTVYLSQKHVAVANPRTQSLSEPDSFISIPEVSITAYIDPCGDHESTSSSLPTSGSATLQPTTTNPDYSVTPPAMPDGGLTDRGIIAFNKLNDQCQRYSMTSAIFMVNRPGPTHAGIWAVTLTSTMFDEIEYSKGVVSVQAGASRLEEKLNQEASDSAIAELAPSVG